MKNKSCAMYVTDKHLTSTAEAYLNVVRRPYSDCSRITAPEKLLRLHYNYYYYCCCWCH